MSEELKNELKGTILESVDKRSLDYGVPDDYFSQLDNQILNKLNQENGASKVKSISPTPLWLSIAASFLLMISCVFLWKSCPQSYNPFEEASQEDMMHYASIEMDLSDLALEDFVDETEHVDFGDLNTNEVNEYVEEHIEISELEEILDYL